MEQFAPVKRSKDGQPVRYLIVDDSVFARKNLARMIESFGGQVAAEAGDDEADASSKLFEREHELALSNNTRELLEQTEHALDRIEAGTYGVCESCGKPIGKARLQAFPRATLCVACKQRQERR